jgi:hypothetical protein
MPGGMLTDFQTFGKEKSKTKWKICYYFFIIIILSGVVYCGHYWYQPQMIGDGDCGEIGGMKIGRENRSTRRNPAPAPLLSTTNPT